MGVTPPPHRAQKNAQVARRGLLEPAKGARGGHPRTVPYAKMSSKGRIELQIGVSRAKIRKEPAGDVRFCLAPRKPTENCEKLIFRSIFPKFSERVQMHPNASRSIRAHPNASERVQTGPSRSQNVKKLAKTCKNLRKLAKQSRNF